MDDSDERGDSFARIEKSTSVDEREKIVKSPVRNEYTCLYYAMYNSLRAEKHRITFSKDNLKHPSKAFVDFMINDPISTEQKIDMRRLLISFKRREFDKRISVNVILLTNVR